MLRIQLQWRLAVLDLAVWMTAIEP